MTYVTSATDTPMYILVYPCISLYIPVYHSTSLYIFPSILFSYNFPLFFFSYCSCYFLFYSPLRTEHPHTFWYRQRLREMKFYICVAFPQFTSVFASAQMVQDRWRSDPASLWLSWGRAGHKRSLWIVGLSPMILGTEKKEHHLILMRLQCGYYKRAVFSLCGWTLYTTACCDPLNFFFLYVKS